MTGAHEQPDDYGQDGYEGLSITPEHMRELVAALRRGDGGSAGQAWIAEMEERWQDESPERRNGNILRTLALMVDEANGDVERIQLPDGSALVVEANPPWSPVSEEP